MKRFVDCITNNDQESFVKYIEQNLINDQEQDTLSLIIAIEMCYHELDDNHALGFYKTLLIHGANLNNHLFDYIIENKHPKTYLLLKVNILYKTEEKIIESIISIMSQNGKIAQLFKDKTDIESGIKIIETDVEKVMNAFNDKRFLDLIVLQFIPIYLEEIENRLVNMTETIGIELLKFIGVKCINHDTYIALSDQEKVFYYLTCVKKIREKLNEFYIHVKNYRKWLAIFNSLMYQASDYDSDNDF